MNQEFNQKLSYVFLVFGKIIKLYYMPYLLMKLDIFMRAQLLNL